MANEINIENPKYEYFLKNASTRISFLGMRLVVMGGYENKLESFAQSIVNKSEQCSDKNFTPSQRLLGLALVKKLNNLYLESDQQLKSSNILTRIFSWLRESSPFSKLFFQNPSRMNIEEKASRNFRTYTGKNFPPSLGELGLPDAHFIVTEEQLQQLTKKERV